MQTRKRLPIPWFMRWLADVLQDDPQNASFDSSADMLLLFFAAGATILGVLSGMIFTMAHASHNATTLWLAKVLFGSAVGGVLGLIISLLLFRFRGILRWEKSLRRKR